jgi:ankyrin repeat protein
MGYCKSSITKKTKCYVIRWCMLNFELYETFMVNEYTKTNPNYVLKDSWSALHFAAYTGAPDEIIKALLDSGADPNIKNNKGKTSVDLAHQEGRFGTASLIEQFIAPTKSANLIV